jgi:DNA-binding transcriptional LysR family regulator
LAKLSRVNFSQLEGQRFVGYERDISTRKALDRILREHGVKAHYTMEFDNIETIKRAVEIGLGIAIVPRLTADHETARGSLKTLEFQEGVFTRPLAIIYKRGRELSPAARKFIEVLASNQGLPKLARAEKSVDRNAAETSRTEPENAEKLA